MPASTEPPAPLRHHTRGIVLMVFSTLCFATNVLLVRALSENTQASVWLITAVRFLTGVALLSAFYWREVEFLRVFTRWKLAGRGIVGGIGIYFFYLTVVHLGAGRATFINCTYPIFGAVMAVWILQERFRVALGVGSMAALAGLALLTNAFATHSHASAYDGLAVLTAFGSAYIVVTIRLLHRDGEHTATIFASQCVYGLLSCAAPAAFTKLDLSVSVWALMLIAGMSAALGQLAMTRAFRDLPVGEGSLLQILVPLGTAGGGAIFFHERLAAHELFGAALIIVGTLVTVAPSRRSAIRT